MRGASQAKRGEKKVPGRGNAKPQGVRASEGSSCKAVAQSRREERRIKLER